MQSSLHRIPSLLARSIRGTVWRASLGSILFGGWAIGSARALDFRVHSMTVEEDSLTLERSYFQSDPNTRVIIELPRTWTVFSDEQSITVAPRTDGSSQIKIEKSTLTPDVPFKDKSLDVYRHAVTTAIPRDATRRSPLEEQDAPLPIFGWKDYEFRAEYDLFGRIYRRSVMFININAREQIMVTAVAAKENFDQVRAEALGIMRSWSSPPKAP